MGASLSELNKTATDDLRTFKRHRIELRILTRLLPQEDAESQRRTTLEKKAGVTSDISMSGLWFNSALSYPIGSLLEIQVTIGVKIYILKAVVRRVREHTIPERTVYIHGVQFVKGEQIIEFIPAMAKYLALLHKKGRI